MTLATPRTPRVNAARKLTRAPGRLAARRFLAEGPQAVEAALSPAGPAARPRVYEVFGTETGLSRHADIVEAARSAGVTVTPVTDEAMKVLSETVTPQGIVAVCAVLDVSLDDVLEGSARLIAVLAEIRDPGNAGTVLRTAVAAGADAVVFAGDSVDPYNGKCVRASAGGLFHVAVVRDVTTATAIKQLRAAGLQVLAADGKGEVELDELMTGPTLDGPTAWVFGNEAHGLGEATSAAADARVRVPIHGPVESLNVAAAAAICLYASAGAQKRGKWVQ
ncbi:MAG: RNA methyltransferase [Mycobacteriales bacterium]